MAIHYPKGWRNTEAMGALMSAEKDGEPLARDLAFLVFKTPITGSEWQCQDLLDQCPQLVENQSMVVSIVANRLTPQR